MGSFLLQQVRHDFRLSTKVGRVFTAPRDPVSFAASDRSWPQGLHFAHHHDYSYDGVMRSHEDILQRLGMNRIDIAVILDLDLVNLGSEALVNAQMAQLTTGGMRALTELKAAGLICAIGAGVNWLGTIPRFLQMLDLDFFLVALPYTLAEQLALDDEFPECQKKGVGIIVGGVFASGILASGVVPGAKYNYNDPTPTEADRVTQIVAICADHGVTLADAALQFPLHHLAVVSVIPGAVNPGQVTCNVQSKRQLIPDARWRDFKSAGLLRRDAPTPPFWAHPTMP